jgi:signal transduction histidine kinase
MRSGLSRRILLPSLATIAFGVLALLVVTYQSARMVAQQELTQRLQRESLLTAKLIDSWLQARITDMTVWSRQEIFSRVLTGKGENLGDSHDEALAALTTLRKNSPFYEDIFLADAQGKMVLRSTMDSRFPAQVDLNDRSLFTETLKGGKVSSPAPGSRRTGKSVFTVTVPVTVRGEVAGIIGGVVDMAVFSALFIDDFQLKKHGYAFLADSRGNAIVSSNKNERDVSEAIQGQSDFPRRIAGNGSGAFINTWQDVQTLTVFQRLQHADWFFSINQSMDATLQPLARIGQISSIAALFILLVISVIIGMLFQRLILERLQSLLRVIAKVKEGDLSNRLPEHGHSTDEITGLIGSFNSMIDQLDRTMTRLNNEIQVRKDTESALAHHQENLERIIARRSLELEHENMERRRAEARLAKAEQLEMIGTLAGGVAHDLNNILSGVVTYPDLLLMKIPADSPLIKPLQAIRQSGKKAAAIVQDLLTLARRGMSIKETVNLNAVLDTCLSSQEYKELRGRYADIEVVVDYAADLPDIIGSPVHLRKTVMNLVNHAAGSMTGGGAIRVWTENRRIDAPLLLFETIGEGEYAVLAVEDRKSTIKEEDLGRIFEPFYTSKKMGKDGTGLDLAVVWGAVKDHGGFIDCESQAGNGTRFTLFFPVHQAPPRSNEISA